MAVERSLGWATQKRTIPITGKEGNNIKILK